MDTLTLEIDGELAAKLRRRAERNGRSIEEEARRMLHADLGREPAFGPASLTEEEVAERRRRLREIGQPPLEPFDQKKFSDELWDFVE